MLCMRKGGDVGVELHQRLTNEYVPTLGMCLQACVNWAVYLAFDIGMPCPGGPDAVRKKKL